MQALRQELRESTGKCRKGVIWLLHIRISVQHLQFSISSSWLAIVTGSVSFELDHVEDANRQQGLRSTAILSCVKWQRQNFLWLLCFTKWQCGWCQVFTVIEASQMLLSVHSGRHEQQWCVEACPAAQASFIQWKTSYVTAKGQETKRTRMWKKDYVLTVCLENS